MKKLLSFLVVSAMLLAVLVPCFALAADELVDGKFVETKKITVEVYQREGEGITPADENVYADFIREGMLRDHNVEVVFQTVGRWTEQDDIQNLLAAGDAPDICVTYNINAINTYGNMGAVIDLVPLFEEYKDLLPNLYNLLGDYNIYYDLDPNTGTLWNIEAYLKDQNRIVTFVRKDWLDKLAIAEPTTTAEFEAMLVAFRDNAELLLGTDADKMVPFSTSYDIGWRANLILSSFVPSDFSDRERYIAEFDDRQFLFPNIKEGVRLLNKWYNEGLLWKNFALYPDGDSTEDDMMKAGYVGSFQHNMDYPYRNGDISIHQMLKAIAGEDAIYVAVDCFTNAEGDIVKYLPASVDRKVFFPSTNDEPLASLLYLDWISAPENLYFLQLGTEGITHEVQEDGVIKILPAVAPHIFNSGKNIDYTITVNGYYLGDDETNAKTLAQSYPGVDPALIQRAVEVNFNGARFGKKAGVGQIAAEEGVGPALKEKRDAMLDQAVAASVEDFDKIFDEGMADYLASGGQAIIDERTAAYDALNSK